MSLFFLGWKECSLDLEHSFYSTLTISISPEGERDLGTGGGGGWRWGGSEGWLLILPIVYYRSCSTQPRAL